MSHQTADAPISLHNTLCVDVTWIWLAVPTQPVRYRREVHASAFAASILVTRESGLAVPTVKRTLQESNIFTFNYIYCFSQATLV